MSFKVSTGKRLINKLVKISQLLCDLRSLNQTTAHYFLTTVDLIHNTLPDITNIKYFMDGTAL